MGDIETQMMMVPSIKKQDNLEMPSPTSQRYRPGNANRPRSSSHKYDLYGLEMRKRKTENYVYAENNRANEGPIDLSASNSVKAEQENDININVDDMKGENDIQHELEGRKMKYPKNKQKKRKVSLSTDENWTIENVPAEHVPKQNVNKREEVLKAARSLFSKRTRTLYHWMYPDTSKGKLKSIVSSAWDTLSNTEKEFYISQVLGRFGVPAGSLMVNPQLGGFQNREIVSPSYAILASANNTFTSDIDGNNSSQLQTIGNEEELIRRPKKRWIKEAENAEISRTHNSPATKSAESYDNDEFADDPELTTELMQFQKAMGQSE